MSKNPLERAWPQWDQRRLSNRREQILHFDLSRKGREAITIHYQSCARHSLGLYTFLRHTKERRITMRQNARNFEKTRAERRNCLTYQEVNSWHQSRCDDEIQQTVEPSTVCRSNNFSISTTKFPIAKWISCRFCLLQKHKFTSNILITREKRKET